MFLRLGDPLVPGPLSLRRLAARGYVLLHTAEKGLVFLLRHLGVYGVEHYDGYARMSSLLQHRPFGQALPPCMIRRRKGACMSALELAGILSLAWSGDAGSPAATTLLWRRR